MSFTSIYIHVVFTTKLKKPFLNNEIRKKVFDHIVENALNKEVKIIAINGYVDHVHCLLSLGSKKSISETVQLIKGESSFWINQSKLLNERFSWQDDYWAESIYRDQLPFIVAYINSQEKHHSKVSLETELNEISLENKKPEINFGLGSKMSYY